MGATSTGISKNLLKLCVAKASDESVIDFSDVDVVERDSFKKTKLWQSYCEAKFADLWRQLRWRLLIASSMRLGELGTVDVEDHKEAVCEDTEAILDCRLPEPC